MQPAVSMKVSMAHWLHKLFLPPWQTRWELVEPPLTNAQFSWCSRLTALGGVCVGMRVVRLLWRIRVEAKLCWKNTVNKRSQDSLDCFILTHQSQLHNFYVKDWRARHFSSNVNMSQYLFLVPFPAYIIVGLLHNSRLQRSSRKSLTWSYCCKTAIGRAPELHQSLTFSEEASSRLFKARAAAI